MNFSIDLPAPVNLGNPAEITIKPLCAPSGLARLNRHGTSVHP